MNRHLAEDVIRALRGKAADLDTLGLPLLATEVRQIAANVRAEAMA